MTKSTRQSLHRSEIFAWIRSPEHHMTAPLRHNKNILFCNELKFDLDICCWNSSLYLLRTQLITDYAIIPTPSIIHPLGLGPDSLTISYQPKNSWTHHHWLQFISNHKTRHCFFYNQKHRECEIEFLCSMINFVHACKYLFNVYVYLFDEKTKAFFSVNVWHHFLTGIEKKRFSLSFDGMFMSLLGLGHDLLHSWIVCIFYKLYRRLPW